MTIKKVEIPWSMIKFFSSPDGLSDVRVTGIDVILVPHPKVESANAQPVSSEDLGDHVESSFHSEESISAAIVAKFLSNIGLLVKDVTVRILPIEHTSESQEFHKLPTVLFRLTQIKVYKNSSKSNENKSSIAESTLKEESEPDFGSAISVDIPPPTPDILNILKSKTFEIGQFSVHLLSSPFDTRLLSNSESTNLLPFPSMYPPINHSSTIL